MAFLLLINLFQITFLFVGIRWVISYLGFNQILLLWTALAGECLSLLYVPAQHPWWQRGFTPWKCLCPVQKNTFVHIWLEVHKLSWHQPCNSMALDCVKCLKLLKSQKVIPASRTEWSTLCHAKFLDLEFLTYILVWCTCVKCLPLLKDGSIITDITASGLLLCRLQRSWWPSCLELPLIWWQMLAGIAWASTKDF